MGSRYGGLKQVDPVGPGDETVLDYSIYDAIRAGFSKVVFVIRKDIEPMFVERFGTRIERHVEVQYVFQELGSIPAGFEVPPGRTKPWGTCHALLMADGAVHGNFAVINADDFYGRNSYRVLARHLQSSSEDYAMVGFPLLRTLSEFGGVSRGVCEIGTDGFLRHIAEVTRIERAGSAAKYTDDSGREHALNSNSIVSMNMWGFTPKIFLQVREHFREFLLQEGMNLKSECYLPSVIQDLIHAKEARVRVLQTQEGWFGITYREDRARVTESIRALISAGAYPECLWT